MYQKGWVLKWPECREYLRVHWGVQHGLATQSQVKLQSTNKYAHILFSTTQMSKPLQNTFFPLTGSDKLWVSSSAEFIHGCYIIHWNQSWTVLRTSDFVLWLYMYIYSTVHACTECVFLYKKKKIHHHYDEKKILQ